MKRTTKKASKNRKKFYIILSCYVIIFVMTSFFTMATLAWFGGSTWQANELFMGGPVYIYISDDTGDAPKSGAGQLVMETPPNWTTMYPGMNMYLEASAVVQGKSFTQHKNNGDEVIVYTTGAVLRAKLMITVTQPDGTTNSDVTNELYSWLWPQLKAKAVADTSNAGVWAFDHIDTDIPENNFFYYVAADQTEETGNLELKEVGGVDYNQVVKFLNRAVFTMPPIATNLHADCTIKFTIVFHALQAFFPYEDKDVGELYQGDTTGRSIYVTESDVGLAKPLTIKNSRGIFTEALSALY